MCAVLSVVGKKELRGPMSCTSQTNKCHILYEVISQGVCYVEATVGVHTCCVCVANVVWARDNTIFIKYDIVTHNYVDSYWCYTVRKCWCLINIIFYTYAKINPNKFVGNQWMCFKTLKIIYSGWLNNQQAGNKFCNFVALGCWDKWYSD